MFILIFHFERLQVKVNMLFMAKLDWPSWKPEFSFNYKQNMAQITPRQYFHVSSSVIFGSEQTEHAALRNWSVPGGCSSLRLWNSVQQSQWLWNHSNTKRDVCACSYYFIHVLGILSCSSCWQTNSVGFFLFLYWPSGRTKTSSYWILFHVSAAVSLSWSDLC